GPDADQDAVADGAAVQGDVVGDRAVLADHRGLAADVDHHEVLDVRPRADTHGVHLGADHDVGPNRRLGGDLDGAVELGAGMDAGGGVDVDERAEAVGHRSSFSASSGRSTGI